MTLTWSNVGDHLTQPAPACARTCWGWADDPAGAAKIDRLADQLLDWWGHVRNITSFSRYWYSPGARWLMLPRCPGLSQARASFVITPARASSTERFFQGAGVPRSPLSPAARP